MRALWLTLPVTALVAWWTWEPDRARGERSSAAAVEAPADAEPDNPVTKTGRRGRVLWWGKAGGPATFSFRAGNTVIEGRASKFAAELPDGVYRVRDMIVDGDRIKDQEEFMILQPGVQPVLRVDPLIGPVLRIVEDPSGRPIAGARVYERKAEENYPSPATLAQSPIRTDADGTARLAPVRGPRVFWVHADGYQWKAARIDPVVTPHKTVALPVGCQLRVFVPDVDLCAGLYLEFLNQRLEVTGPEMLFDGLPIGRGDLDLRRGESLDPIGSFPSGKIRIATKRIDLQPARAAVVRFEPWIDRPTWVRELRGRVTLAAGWPAADLEVAVIVPGKTPVLGRSTAPFWIARVPVTDGRFVVRGMAPGEYTFEVLPTAYTTTLQVPHAPIEVNIEVPPPNPVEVRLIDAETKATIRHGYLVYELFGLSQPPVVVDDDVHKIFLNTWGITLYPLARGYAGENTGRLSFKDHGTEHAFELKPAASLAVELMRDGKPVLVNGGAVSVEGSYYGSAFRRGRAFVHEAPPGIRGLQIKPPAGLEVDAPTTVTLRKREHRVLRLSVR